MGEKEIKKDNATTKIKKERAKTALAITEKVMIKMEEKEEMARIKMTVAMARMVKKIAMEMTIAMAKMEIVMEMKIAMVKMEITMEMKIAMTKMPMEIIMETTIVMAKMEIIRTEKEIKKDNATTKIKKEKEEMARIKMEIAMVKMG